MSLPFCFLKHLYYETKVQLVSIYEFYIQDEQQLQSILAPLLLVCIVAIMGLTLVATGLYGIALALARGLFQLVISSCTLLVKYAWTMANQLMWLSVCSTVILGGGVWIWSKVRSNKRTTIEGRVQNGGSKASTAFQVPSISTILPWIIGLSSPALYEAIVSYCHFGCTCQYFFLTTVCIRKMNVHLVTMMMKMRIA